MSGDAELLERMESGSSTCLGRPSGRWRRIRAWCGVLSAGQASRWVRSKKSDVRQYLLDMVESRSARGTFSINLCGIRFFWKDTLGLEWKIFDLAKPRYDKKLPVVLSRDEAWRILDEVTIEVYRVCLTTIYSCGLRLLEGATREIPQIDTPRMQLHIHGKGGRDRFVPLPEGTLLMLRSFWRTHRCPIWLFPAVTRMGLKHSLETRGRSDSPLEPAGRIPSSARQSRHPQEGAHPHAAPFLRDAPARGRGESPSDPEVSRALERAHDPDLHPSDERGLRPRQGPCQSTDEAADEKAQLSLTPVRRGRARGDLSRRRACVSAALRRSYAALAQACVAVHSCLPHARSRRREVLLSPMRAQALRLPLLPGPALSHLPGSRRRALAGKATQAAAAMRVRFRDLYGAGGFTRVREVTSAQGVLDSHALGGSRTARGCVRPPLRRWAHRSHGDAAHVVADDDPPPARASGLSDRRTR